MDPKIAKRLAKLVAMLGASNARERENAQRRIDAILRRFRRSWAELPELLRSAASTARVAQPSSSASDDLGDDNLGDDIGPLDLLDHVLRKHISMQDHEILAVALWVLHTHVFERFMVSPRLALISPVRGCGKTTLLSMLEVLCHNPLRSDGFSAASTFRVIDSRQARTLLFDEADGYDFQNDGGFRQILNSGHRRGGKIVRVIEGQPRIYSTFAPMALACIGTLPLPLMHRSVVIDMKRASHQLERLEDTAALDAVHQAVYGWARKATLDSDPSMPRALRNRFADNWRPLLSIADACGPEWGVRARQAAITMSTDYQDEDVGVTLLSHIREIFEAHAIDRIASAGLVEALIGMDEAPWCEWRGIRGDQQPRSLSQGELARLLAPFRIRSRSIWPRTQRTPDSKSRKGYFRADFEAAWQSYCRSGTPAQPRNIKALRLA
jgi:hypothetical protein